MNIEWIPVTPETLPPDGVEILFTTILDRRMETKYGFCQRYLGENNGVEEYSFVEISFQNS